MNRRGFTIVELIIVIAIMGILLVLVAVNLRGSQANARDVERKADVESIALHAETFYSVGNNSGSAPGSYPSTFTSSNTNVYIRSIMQDLDIKSLLAPGITDEAFKSFISATNTDQTALGVLPAPTTDTYVYQPLLSSGAICTSSSLGCRKFNIFYRLEVANISENCPSPGYICKVTSKYQ